MQLLAMTIFTLNQYNTAQKHSLQRSSSLETQWKHENQKGRYTITHFLVT